MKLTLASATGFHGGFCLTNIPFGGSWIYLSFSVPYPNNRKFKKISIPSIVWVEENADFLKVISITPTYFSIFYIIYIYILNMYMYAKKSVPCIGPPSIFL
jgi:hypothetical protein